MYLPVSLKQYLLYWLVAVQLAVAGVFIVAAWWTGRHEAKEIIDGQLIAVARVWLSLSNQDQHMRQEQMVVPERVKDYVQDVAVLRWLDGHLVIDTHGIARHPSLQLPLGLTDVSLNIGGQTKTWRAYVVERREHDGLDRLAVLMNSDHQWDFSKDVALHMLYPAFFLLPFSVFLMLVALSRGIQPLEALSDDIAKLRGVPNERLTQRHPFNEFASTVAALNGLMDRSDRQLAREKAFASDVAHELRTPLASLALNARVLASRTQMAEAVLLEQDALRAGAILNQLIMLARAESDTKDQSHPIDLYDCAIRVLSNLAQEALDTEHDLELEDATSAITVFGQPLAIELALSNVVRNALLHTPKGSRIGVAVVTTAQQIGLRVEDWPTSQPADQPQREGLGLGLRLVERLMVHQGGCLSTEAKLTGGRCVQLLWPRNGDTVTGVTMAL